MVDVDNFHGQGLAYIDPGRQGAIDSALGAALDVEDSVGASSTVVGWGSLDRLSKRVLNIW
jgi:hypothetical protein